MENILIRIVDKQAQKMKWAQRCMRSILTLLLLLGPLAIFAITPQEAVNRFADTPRMPKGSMAVIVSELPKGRVIASYNTDMPLTPASIMKSVTLASASEIMDVEKEMITPVIIDGPVNGGVLQGNLLIEGVGDPSVNTTKWPKSEDITTEIITALKREGITSIAGNIIIDESYLSGSPIPPDWAQGDLGTYYGTGNHAFNYRDNAQGKSSVKDPGAVFIRDLTAAMSKTGINVEGATIEGGKRKTILHHKSAPLKEIMRSCMMRSDNMFAESMLRQFGKESGMDGSTPKAASEEMKFWRNRRAPMEGVVIIDGSGLSRKNKVTANFMESVLRSKRNDVEYVSFFPLAGQEGTLRNFLKDTPLDAYIAMKTGSMRGIQCYAGYKLDEDFAPTHVVVVIVNDFTCDRAYLRQGIERLLLDIFSEENP
ncbi:MAG: D-alanyl-D-alanine carboxypeptidase [Muribaculaceae bacterium]|nr:D-alanyl-D-alanine carboxypeptidase [Muribaculaceae bacterium]